MKKRRGSFNEKKQPIITLRDAVRPSDSGSIVIHHPELRSADPVPNSWIMLKPGDIVASQSGTIRMLVRKNWQAGRADCLRFRCELEAEKLGASLDLEKIDIDSSNFEHLLFVLRDINRTTAPELSPDHFSKTIRFNALTLLGFGSVGSKLHQALPSPSKTDAPNEVTLALAINATSGQFINIFYAEELQAIENLNEQALIFFVSWVREPVRKLYRIFRFEYPPGTSALTIETVTLASEVANSLSFASDMLSEYLASTRK